MKIRNKMLVIAVVMGSATGVASGVGLYALSQSRASAAAALDGATEVQEALKFQNALTDIGLNSRAILMAADAKEAKEYADRIVDDFAEIDAGIRLIKETLGQEELAALAKFETALPAFADERKHLAQVAVEQGPDAAREQSGGAKASEDLTAKREALERTLSDFRGLIQQSLADDRDAADALADQMNLPVKVADIAAFPPA